jgi:hypothetical protein
MLNVDGWYLEVQEGSHRQFKHPIKKRESYRKWKTQFSTFSRIIEQYIQTSGLALKPVPQNKSKYGNY